MKKELDEKLCAKYPEIFKDRFGDMRKTAMCWGFDVGDGWYNIIDALCASLYYDYKMAQNDFEYKLKIVQRSDYRENLNDEEQKYRVFSTPIEVERARLKMIEERQAIPVAVQVKEKFGCLRFYVDNATIVHHKLIAMAENLSSKTCDVCGAPATPKKVHTGWISTRCDEHKNAQ